VRDGARVLTLYGSAPAYGVCDLSPFVVKVATWCRMAGVPYETAVTDPRKAPKGKIPYVRDGGAVIAATRGFDSPGAARDRIVASKTLTAYLDRIEAKYWAKP